MTTRIVAILLIVLTPAYVRAGVYYSGETYAPLPAQWRGFLLDHRALRSIATKPSAGNPVSMTRQYYLDEAVRLEKIAKPAVSQLADLGAIYLRLGETNKALAILRSAEQQFPGDFAVVANLGAAYQAAGELDQAIRCLEQAVKLAPAKLKAAEEMHLKLVRLRRAKAVGPNELDNLFDVRYETPDGKYEPGAFPDKQKDKVSADAVAIAQQLALWFPDDGALLWQLAELANGYGDKASAAAMMDGCVTQFQMQSPMLRKHRQLTRAAADALPAIPAVLQPHEQKHAGTLAFASRRPLLAHIDIESLPAVDPHGVNAIPWEVLTETTIAKPFRPDYSNYLINLEDQEISLLGFMQPLQNTDEMTTFLFIEYPVGCWYCEMPDLAGIVRVQLEDEHKTTFRRTLLRVVGRLSLNRTDPERFLFELREAHIAAID